LHAFAATFPQRSREAHLLLVGDRAPQYDARAAVDALGIRDKVTITGYVPDEQLDAWIHAADVCLCLRWPTAGETSGPWIRCLGAGKPTIVSAIAQHRHVPTLDARTGTLVEQIGEPVRRAGPTSIGAVAVSVDLIDEPQALPLAMRGPAADAETPPPIRLRP